MTSPGPMDGAPEGTTPRPIRLSRGWLVLSVVFVLYLLFRLVQGVLWLVHHL